MWLERARFDWWIWAQAPQVYPLARQHECSRAEIVRNGFRPKLIRNWPNSSFFISPPPQQPLSLEICWDCGVPGGLRNLTKDKNWRRRRDSNSRRAFTLAGFQDQCIQPLCHPSAIPECYTNRCVRGKDKTASIGPQAAKCVDFARLTGMIIDEGHGWIPRVQRIEYLPFNPH